MSNLKVMPISGQCNSNSDVATFLRLLADQVERGDRAEVRTAIVTFENIGGTRLTTLVAGLGGTDNARVMGLLAIAAHTYMDDQ